MTYLLYIATLLSLSLSAFAAPAKLAIVIDDFGYRLSNERQLVALSPAITVSVLPDSPHAEQIADIAHENGNDVMIHLPMLPLSKQPLEKNTLTPDMSVTQIKQIVDSAIRKVPFAIGINNHMGSAMTSNLTGMQRMMEAIVGYPLFFLDSKTVTHSQVKSAAKDFRKRVFERDVFLDDTIDVKVITQQYHRAIAVARKNGVAIVIGHPHRQTVQVLSQMLPHLPKDVRLVKMSELLTDAEPEPPEEIFLF